MSKPLGPEGLRSALTRSRPQLFAGLVGLAVAMVLIALSLASPSAAADERQGVPIFVYHRFDPATAGPTTVTVTAFEAQLAWLAQHDYRIVPLRTALAELNGAIAQTATTVVVITVDDGPT